MLLSLSLRTVVLVVIGLGRMVCSGFCVLLKIVLGCSLLCLCSLAGGGSSWCCCSVHLHCTRITVYSFNLILTVHINNTPQYCKTLGIPIVKEEIWMCVKVKVKV